MQFYLIFFIALSSIFAFSADHRPWYRSRKWQERKIEKEAKRQDDINWHKDGIIKEERRIRLNDRNHEKLKEERREIPPGSTKRKDLLAKLDESRKVEANTQRQQLAAYLLQHDNKHVSHALWENIKNNIPKKQQRLKEEMNKLKSENTIDPNLEPIHDQHYEIKDWAFKRNRWAYEDILKDHKEALKTLQQKASKKKGLWKWASSSNSHLE